MVRGLPIVGPAEESAFFDKYEVEATLTPEALLATSPARRERLEAKILRESKLAKPEMLKAITDKTMKEVSLKQMGPPRSKEYFNTKHSASQQDISLSAVKKGLTHSRNDSQSNVKVRGLDPLYKEVQTAANDLNHLLQSNNVTNQTIHTTWNPSSKIARTRQDVSFL